MVNCMKKGRAGLCKKLKTFGGGGAPISIVKAPKLAFILLDLLLSLALFVLFWYITSKCAMLNVKGIYYVYKYNCKSVNFTT